MTKSRTASNYYYYYYYYYYYCCYYVLLFFSLVTGLFLPLLHLNNRPRLQFHTAVLSTLCMICHV